MKALDGAPPCGTEARCAGLVLKFTTPQTSTATSRAQPHCGGSLVHRPLGRVWLTACSGHTPLPRVLEIPAALGLCPAAHTCPRLAGRGARDLAAVLGSGAATRGLFTEREGAPIACEKSFSPWRTQFFIRVFLSIET